MRVQGSGMKEHPGTEVGCSDSQWVGRGRSTVLLQRERSCTCRLSSYGIFAETSEGILVVLGVELPLIQLEFYRAK